jgi:transposase
VPEPCFFASSTTAEEFGQWVHRLAERAPRNKVVVAIANKLARIAWAVLSSGKDYRHQPLQPAAA